MRAVNPIAIGQLRQHIAQVYSAAQKSPKTLQQLDHVLRLAELAGVKTTADLSTAAVARVLSARGEAANPNTSRGLIGRLRRCANVAVRERWLDRDDAPDWGSLWPRPAPSRVTRHTAEDVRRLLASLAGPGDWYQARLHALAALVAYTGLRRQEALFCRVTDLELTTGFVFVQARVGRRLKTLAAAAPVPLADALVVTLRGWVPECGGEWLFPGAHSQGPWSGGSPGYRPLDRLREAGRAVGIDRVGFHSLRHTLATELLIRSVPLWAIQRILRHTTPLTTEHYLHPSDLDCAAHVRGFSFG
jgi:integrase